ncbi:uncharacterized protein [Nicotiana tomentosiformis]|uniref:uncharacterized protein n=1 Tax=Nicotiana tomentosiformis TaxID=4098 RepID=UPI00388CCA39
MQANDKVLPKAQSLTGFDNSSVITKGEVLLTTFAEGDVNDMKFQVVDADMAYNIILGRPWIHDMDVVPSILHQIIKFPSKWGIRQIRRDQQDTRNKSYRRNTRDTHEHKRPAEMNMKNSSPGEFEWTDECQQALKDLKLYLSNSPLLAKPKNDKRLLIYLIVSEVAVSAILVREDKGFSRFCSGFQQYLVPEVEKELHVFTRSNPGTYILLTDGSSNVKGANLGIVLTPPSGEVIRQAIKCYPITNNEAEYEAVIAGLELAQELGREQIMIRSDSQLVVNQMQGTCVAREARMQQYLEKVQELLRQFQLWKAVQIPREENAEADALANLAFVTDVTNTENAIVIHLFHSALNQDKSEIKRITSAPYHPAANGQAESTNKVIINNLKKRLEESKEIGEPSMRYTHLTEEANKEEMRVNLDLLEERREATLVRMAAQKQMIERYYNRKANLRYFKIGDFVLKKVFQSTKVANAGKLSPNWEGPYKVRCIAGKGAYELETMDGKVLPSNWNAVHLKKYYF